MEQRERKYDASSTLLLLQQQQTKKQSRNLVISSSSALSYRHELPEKSHMLSNTRTTTSDYVAEEKRVSAKRRRKPKMESVTMEDIQQNIGKPIGEASKRLGVSRSTLKRICRKLNIPSWPKPHRNMKYKHLSIHVVVLILVKVKRWSCSSNRHGFEARWWICGKHSSFVLSKPYLTIEAHGTLMIASSSKESDDSIETLHPIPKPPQARSDMLSASPEKSMAKVSQDIRTVTVKATYKDDMIKFQFPLSSGLLELKQEVARRFMLESTRLHLKYWDEDGDLILVACDADLSILIMPYSATRVGNNTIKLMVEIADD